MPGTGERHERHDHRPPSVQSVLSRAWSARALALLAATTLVLTACGTGTGGSPAPTPLPTPQFGDVGWDLVGAGPFPNESVFPGGIAVRNDTVVVLGLSPQRAADAHPLLWSSTSGGAWKAATIKGDTGGSPASVISFADGFLAVGAYGCPNGGIYSITLVGCRPAIWTSADGATWTRVTIEETVNAQLTSVVAWDGGLLAVGGREDPSNPARNAALVLRSADAVSWQAVAPLVGLDAPVTDVAADGERLVAVGPAPGAHTQAKSATAWSSIDGKTWTREPLPGGESGSQWARVAATPEGFGAIDVGSSPEGPLNASVWRRGAEWDTVIDSQRVSNAGAMDIASGPFGALVVGLDWTYAPVLYASHDGIAWGLVAPAGDMPAEAFAPVSATWDQGRFYVVGVKIESQQVLVLAGMAYVPYPGELPAPSQKPRPTPSPTPTPAPVASEAAGAATVTLTRSAGYVAQKNGSGICQSVAGDEAVAHIGLFDVGTVSGQPLDGQLDFVTAPAVGSKAELVLTATRVDNAGGETPRWVYSASVSKLAEDGMSGTLTLADGAGSLTWRCNAWQDADWSATRIAGRGTISLDISTTGWLAAPEPATCGADPQADVSGVSGVVGTLNGDPITVSLDLRGRSHVGQPIVTGVMNQASPGMGDTIGLVTLTAVTGSDRRGSGTFSLRFPAARDGWPARVTGTLSWQCPGRTDTDEKPLPACAVSAGPAPGPNLAASAASTVSSELASEPRSAAFDGNLVQGWNSGTYAIGWIEVDLGKAAAVGEVRAWVAQTPAGHTEHHLYGRATADGPLVELTACGGVTNDQQILAFTVPAGTRAVRYLRLETVSSPSWIAWREIQVFAAP